MKPLKSLKLFSDCFGDRFEASRVLQTVPSCGR